MQFFRLVERTGRLVTMLAVFYLASFAAIADSSAELSAEEAKAMVRDLKAQMGKMMDQMQSKIDRLESQIAQSDAKIQQQEERVEREKEVKDSPLTGMVFFRSGYSRLNQNRYGNILTDANSTNALTQSLTQNTLNGNQDAWYFGAGFELGLSDDLFGLMEDTQLLGEITINYKEFDSTFLNRSPLGTAANDATNGTVLCTGGGVLGTPDGIGPYASCSNSVTVSQISLTASPKIKFLASSDFSPWIIPAGFTLNVISPPSNGVTVTAPGVMFGLGADYRLWKNVYVGFDGRYNIVGDSLDGVDLDGFDVGGYLGFGF